MEQQAHLHMPWHTQVISTPANQIAATNKARKKWKLTRVGVSSVPRQSNGIASGAPVPVRNWSRWCCCWCWPLVVPVAVPVVAAVVVVAVAVAVAVAAAAVVMAVAVAAAAAAAAVRVVRALWRNGSSLGSAIWTCGWPHVDGTATEAASEM